MVQENELLQRLTQVITGQFTAACTEREYRVLAANADRHGSLVWEAGRARELNCYVLLGMIEVPPSTVPVGVTDRTQRTIGAIESLYESELWIAADDNERFTRILYDRWYVFLSHKVPALPPPPLPERLAAAIDRVEGLTRRDLTESYIIPRGEGSRSAVGSS